MSSVSSVSSSPIPPPPYISMPVWSLSCRRHHDGHGQVQDTNCDDTQDPSLVTSMNIMTFCMPVSVQPQKRLWALSLYHNTLTKDSLLSSDGAGNGVGILQLLTPSHQDLIPILGKQSGRDINKFQACQNLRFPWKAITVPNKTSFKNENDDTNDSQSHHYVIPSCALYLQIQTVKEEPPESSCLVGTVVTMDANDHVVVLCQVLNTGIWNVHDHSVQWLNNNDPLLEPLDAPTVLYSGWLRQQGIL